MIVDHPTYGRIDDAILLAKSLIGPTDLANGGTLTPQQAQKLISLLWKDGFLSKVTTVRMSKLTRNVDVIDILRRQLVRVAQGEEPTTDDLTKGAEFGCKLTALDAQLFATLTLDYLKENKDNPQLQKEIETGFNTVLQNDIVDLGFNGIEDDGAGNTREEKFLHLNKGWLQVAREADGAQKIAIDPATDGWIATLKGVTELQDHRALGSSVYVMNTADADEYGEEINAPVTGHEVQSGSPARRFRGRNIEAHPNFPQGKVLFTPIKNLVYGLHTTIDRNRAYHNRRRALEYTFDMSFDFEIAVKKFAVLGE